MPSPPPRRESFHFSPPGTNPPDYSAAIALANDSSSGILTLTRREKAVLKETYTVNSMSSYSCSESGAKPAEQTRLHALHTDANNRSTSSTSNKQVQERKVSSVKITPLTIPDPPDHVNSYRDPQTKLQTTPSLPPPPPPTPPQRGATLSQPRTQTASLSVHLGTRNRKNPQPRLQPNPEAEVKLPGDTRYPNSGSAAEMTAPPVVPPRPSPAELLVHT